MVRKQKTETVYLYAQSGMALGEYLITSCDDEVVTILLRNGSIARFSRLTGKQIRKTKGHEMFITDEPFKRERYKVTL